MQTIGKGWFNILISYDFCDERDMTWCLAYQIWIECLDGKFNDWKGLILQDYNEGIEPYAWHKHG
jgi:hypothetical protein